MVLHHFYGCCIYKRHESTLERHFFFQEFISVFFYIKVKRRRGLNYVCKVKTIFFLRFYRLIRLYVYSVRFILPLGITNDFFGKFHVVYMTRIKMLNGLSLLYIHECLLWIRKIFGCGKFFIYFFPFTLGNVESFFFLLFLLDRKRSIDMTINLSQHKEMGCVQAKKETCSAYRRIDSVVCMK